MALSICVNIHEQVILLGEVVLSLEHFLNIAALEAAVNKKGIRLHNL